MLKFIVAGTRHEYEAWMRDKKYSPRDYSYVSSADMLRGRVNIEGFYIGTYKTRKDIQEIQIVIQYSKRNPPHKPSTGEARINTETGLAEYYDGNDWISMKGTL